MSSNLTVNTTLTIFACPKSFNDQHTIISQNNAIKSWRQLGENIEIILMGDDDGIKEKAEENDCLHIGNIKNNSYGTPLLNDIFEKAEKAASSSFMCYINADIILMPSFFPSIESAIKQLESNPFLLVGRRFTQNIAEMIDFSDSSWYLTIIKETDDLDPYTATDYFIFPKGSIKMPPFAIGRPAWDNWTLWDARQRGAMLIDATHDIKVIHQKHDYQHVKKGINNTWEGPEAMENRRIAGGYNCMCNILDSTHLLRNGKVVPVRTLLHLCRRFYQLLRKIKHKFISV
jgi:hypothetical protein